MNNPISVNLGGQESLTGAGFLFKFAVEHGRVFERNGDSVSVLKELFEGITIDGVTLSHPANIEFVMSDLL